MIMPILLLVELRSVSLNIIQVFKRKMSYKFKTETNNGYISTLPNNAQRRSNSELKPIWNFWLHDDRDPKVQSIFSY